MISISISDLVSVWDGDDLNVKNDIQRILERLQSKYEIVGLGRNRVVFRDKDWVFKVPCNTNGVLDNENESSVYHSYRKNHLIKYARCKMCSPYVLVMEYVDIDISLNDMPDWAMSIDCQQVGRDRQGNIVAYDFGTT